MMNRRQILLRALLAAFVLASVAGCEKIDHLASGRDYFTKGEYDAAIVQLRNAVQGDPLAAEARALLADALERKHDLAGVQEQLSKAIENGGDANTLVPRLALIMLDRNELEPLVRTYGEMHLDDPAADSSLRGTVALALLGQQRTEAARAQITRAARPAPSINLAQAQLLVAEGKAREALALLDLDAPGQAAPWWVLRAAKRIAVSLDDRERALAYMKRARDAVPWHGGAVGEYAEALVTAGKATEAEPILQQLRKNHPGLFWSHYVDALLQHRAGRFEEAHAAALRALRFAPDHVPSQLIASSAELQAGDVIVAQRRLQALLRKNPGSLAGWQLYARAQARLGQKAELATAIQRGLELSPRDAQLLGMQAEMQLAARQFKPALATLSALLAARPDDTDAMLKLAAARMASGDKAGATALVQKAGETAADAAASARVVAQSLRMGNTAAARQLAAKTLARFPDDAQAQLSLGAVQSAENDRKGAWNTTIGVLDKRADHAGALNALTAMARSPEQHQELLTRYEAAIDGGTRVPQIYLDYAGLLRGSAAKKTNTPRAVLDKAVQLMPTLVPLREAYIEQLFREGDTDKAVSVAETGATMANAASESAVLLATTYERLGKTQQAAETLRKLVAAQPQRSDWRLRLAQLESALGRNAEAVTLLRSLQAERGGDIQPSLMLARLLADTDVDGALAVARQLGEQPEYKAAALLLAGDVLARAGRTDAALQQFDEATKAGAGSHAVIRVVQLLDSAGRAEAAERELDAALRRHPEDAPLSALQARRLQQQGQHARAIAIWEKLAARAPNDPYVLNDLAWAQVAGGRPEALAHARRAAALLPNNANVIHTLGIALSKGGKQADAIDALRLAANLEPRAALPRLHLAQHLALSGDKIGAAQALRTLDAERLPVAEKPALDKLKTELGVS